MWWNRRNKSNSAREEEPNSMERAEAALDEVQESQVKARGLLFYLKQEAATNHFSQDFIKMVEKGR